jgi:hypothetical protein
LSISARISAVTVVPSFCAAASSCAIAFAFSCSATLLPTVSAAALVVAMYFSSCSVARS